MISIHRVLYHQKATLRNLIELYKYDFSEFDPEDVNENGLYAEFFVMKKYRKKGVGQYVAVEIFNKFRGFWKVAQIESNLPAQIFWRKIIERYTNNNYQEIREDDWEGPIQTFSTVGDI